MKYFLIAAKTVLKKQCLRKVHLLAQGLAAVMMMVWANNALALTFALPSNGDNIVGHLQIVHSRPGDSFSQLARRYDVGYYELVEANPGIDPSLPTPGTLVVVPTRFVLPPAPYQGIVVNLAELRLYYFPPGTHEVITYPVGIGRQGWMTPVGLTRITQKTANPTWVVPDSIRAWRAAQGVQLPAQVPPGPDNPLGGYAMRLGYPTYLIHGTNDYTGVGRRSSSGCIRMYPEDVEDVFARVSVNTPVRIINTSYKAGVANGKLYLEAHVPLQEQLSTGAATSDAMNSAILAATKLHHDYTVVWNAAERVAKIQNGIPQVVGQKEVIIANTM